MLLIFIHLVFWWVVYQPSLFGPPRSASVSGTSADPARLRARVEKLVSLGPRDWQNTENLDRVADYLVQELQSYGLRPERQTFEAEQSTFQNILIRFGPPEGKRIVIGAHYDVCEPLPGADDNGSGVAAVLELARALARRPPESPVELVFYTLEEPPFFGTEKMGSYVHAKSLREAGVELEGMISVETIGYFTDEPDSQDFPVPILKFFYPTRGNFIAAVGNLTSRTLARDVRDSIREATDLPAYSVNGPAITPAFSFSDHWPYWMHGYPAVMLTDTAFLRNKEYHQAGDTPERLNYAKMADVVKGLETYARRGTSSTAGSK